MIPVKECRVSILFELVASPYILDIAMKTLTRFMRSIICRLQRYHAQETVVRDIW